jgi:hypothetical protein
MAVPVNFRSGIRLCAIDETQSSERLPRVSSFTTATRPGIGFMTCELCKRTEQNARGKYVHERLQQVGVTERVTRTARKAIWVTRFHCQLCGTHWRHEDDMHTGRAGWSVELTASAAE